MTTHFVGNIYHPVEIGHIFVIGGKTIDGASLLDISLQSAKHYGCKIPLHLSVRFHENVIIRNSFDTAWLEEERFDNLTINASTNPIISGEYFRIYILLGDLCFHISINGYPYCTFMYRVPIEEIRTIYIDKDIQTIRQIDHRTSFPSPYPMIQCEPEPGIIFSNDVPQRFRPGHVIIITAIPNGNRKGRFTIVFLQNGTRKECFHYNLRFEPHFMIVRNSMNDNLQFEREEKDGPFPFCIEQQFKLAFGLTKTKFKFAVDGHYLGSFNYRQKNLLDVLNGFKIHGCSGLTVEVTTVDHLNIGNSKCKNFEIYSDPNNHVL